jgi:predicted PhzF superfamily epimerase YddE/YHI9
VTPCEKPELLEKSLGVSVLSLAHNETLYLAEIASEEALRSLKPNFGMMGSFLDKKMFGIIVTCASMDPTYDFVSRFFAPAAGIPEDPVTGSAHCYLGPFWSKRSNKNSFLAYQASARGGVIKVRCEKDRVFLGGQAVTVLRGELV